jgi:hypothetical protein
MQQHHRTMPTLATRPNPLKTQETTLQKVKMASHHCQREDIVTATGGAATGHSEVDEEVNLPRGCAKMTLTTSVKGSLIIHTTQG